jgi:tRNA modification GTPase
MYDLVRGDTIVAVSTPPGFGGIGLVRLSGKKALDIASAFFVPAACGTRIRPGRAVFGHLVEAENGRRLDQGYLIYFKAPHSYTKEDVVELNLHGSPAVLDAAVRCAVKQGARPAHPGEFTLRAFFNGRFDIIQAEAVNDLVHATSLDAARLAFEHVDGKFSKRLSDLRSGLMKIQADIEAFLEFPDERLPVSPGAMTRSLERIIRFLEDAISSYDAGKGIIEGTTIALVGRTNVGKSTLFNALLEEDRAIVNPRPGTTRDYLKERIRIQGAQFSVVDMAGLESSAKLVEREGIKKGKKIADQADGLLILLDVSRKETQDDRALLEAYRERKALVIFNKIDLPRKMDQGKVRKWGGRLPSVEISALTGENLAAFRRAIYRIFTIRLKKHDITIFHLRQKSELEGILAHSRNALTAFSRRGLEDIAAEEIRSAVEGIGRLTGEIRTDDVLEDIFCRFCVGK